MRVSWRACMFALDFKDLVWLTLCRSNHKTPRHTSTAESVLMIALVWLKLGGLKFHLRVCGSISNLYCMLKTCETMFKETIFDAQIPKKGHPFGLIKPNHFFFFFSERTPHIFLRIHVPICWRNLTKSPRCHGCFNVAMARHRSSAVAWRAARSWKRSSSSCDRNSPEPLRRVASRWSRWVCGGSLWLMFIKQILLYS